MWGHLSSWRSWRGLNRQGPHNWGAESWGRTGALSHASHNRRKAQPPPSPGPRRVGGARVGLCPLQTSRPWPCSCHGPSGLRGHGTAQDQCPGWLVSSTLLGMASLSSPHRPGRSSTLHRKVARSWPRARGSARIRGWRTAAHTLWTVRPLLATVPSPVRPAEELRQAKDAKLPGWPQPPP